MMLGERSYGSVHAPPWSSAADDPTSHALSLSPTAVSSNGSVDDYSLFFQTDSLKALQRYLPSNSSDVVPEIPCADSDSSEFLPVDAHSCDHFRMFEFKVRKCTRSRSHDWTECPFAHPGEKARRRDPRKHHYSGSACPDFRRGACRRGDACEYAHGVFECWLHPARYRTQPCKDGTHCRRRICFFAHTPEQLRVLPYTGCNADEMQTSDPFVLLGSSPRSAQYSPPSSPMTASPPVSPSGSMRMSQLTESMRGMQINKMKMGLGMGMGMGMSLSMSPPSWGVGYGSPCSPVKIRPGFNSLPATPIRAVTRSGLSAFDLWETECEEEPVMERVESGRALRERIYSKLGKENSLERADSAGAVPDFGWVSELVK